MPAAFEGRKILLVEDDRDIRRVFARYFGSQGFVVEETETFTAAYKSFEAIRPDVAVLDFQLPDGTALDLLPKFKELEPGVPIIILTGFGSMELGVSLIKSGAEQCLAKPVEPPALLLVVQKVLENSRNQQKQLASNTKRQRSALNPFLGESDAIKRLAETAVRVAQSHSPVLVQGETGTGKGVLAAWLHDNSSRAEESFVDLNCAGLSREFLETELFGYATGAYSGAVNAKPGLLEVGHRGTVFLDEVGDVDPDVQPKLLKFIEERRFRRLGDVRDRFVDVRLIAATHQDLLQLIKKNIFRNDLYFRISTVPIVIPPVRERPQDIPHIVGALLQKISVDMARGPVELSQEALQKLRAYSWPGNIRELRNVLERALLLTDKSVLGPNDLIFETRIDQSYARANAGLEVLSQESKEETSAKTAEWLLGNFRLALDCIQDHAVFRLDETGHMQGWNSGAARVYGYTDPEVVGQSFEMFWLAADQARGILEQARISGKAELRVDQIHKTGKRFRAHAIVRRASNQEGTPRDFVCVVRDLTYPILQEYGRHVIEMLAFHEPIGQILESVTRSVEAVFPETRSAVMLLSKDTKHLIYGAGSSVPRQLLNALEESPVEASANASAAAVCRRRTVISANIAIDPLWVNLRGLALEHNLHACWSNPVISSAGNVVGTLDVYYPRPYFPGEADLQIIERALSAVAIAIQHAQAEEDKSRMEQQRHRLLRDLIAAEEQERRRISHELHDGTGQMLTSLLLQLRALQQNLPGDQAAREIEQLRKTTADTLADLRRILQGLHPSALDDFGLVPALRRYALELGKTAKLEVKFFSESMQDWRPPQSVEASVYRATQETLNNIVKHARARTVQVFVKHEAGELRVVVSDDGIGFNPKDALSGVAGSGHFGLFGIRQRIEMLGGSVDVESHPGEGTTISLRIPDMEIA